MIEVRDLLKVFDTRGHVVRAVDNVTTQVAKGEVVFGSVEGNIGGVLRVRRKGDIEEYLAISDFFAVSR